MAKAAILMHARESSIRVVWNQYRGQLNTKGRIGAVRVAGGLQYRRFKRGVYGGYQTIR